MHNRVRSVQSCVFGQHGSELSSGAHPEVSLSRQVQGTSANS